jgi:hypothetical protein
MTVCGGENGAIVAAQRGGGIDLGWQAMKKPENRWSVRGSNCPACPARFPTAKILAW